MRKRIAAVAGMVAVGVLGAPAAAQASYMPQDATIRFGNMKYNPLASEWYSASWRTYVPDGSTEYRVRVQEAFDLFHRWPNATIYVAFYNGRGVRVCSKKVTRAHSLYVYCERPVYRTTTYIEANNDGYLPKVVTQYPNRTR